MKDVDFYVVIVKLLAMMFPPPTEDTGAPGSTGAWGQLPVTVVSYF
jgi:hypothetical protein